MTIREGDFHSEIIRGDQVVCENCKDEFGLWKVLLLVERAIGRQLSKGQKLLVRSVAEYHETEHPDHVVDIRHLKKMSRR